MWRGAFCVDSYTQTHVPVKWETIHIWSFRRYAHVHVAKQLNESLWKILDQSKTSKMMMMIYVCVWCDNISFVRPHVLVKLRRKKNPSIEIEANFCCERELAEIFEPLCARHIDLKWHITRKCKQTHNYSAAHISLGETDNLHCKFSQPRWVMPSIFFRACMCALCLSQFLWPWVFDPNGL